MLSTKAATYILLATLFHSSSAQSSPALVASLRNAATEVDRLQLLNDTNFLFDFNNPPIGSINAGSGGHTVQARSDNFPAIVGKNIAMTIGYLGPCGLNLPHTHPRATEINFSVNTTLRAGVLVENGARFIDVEIRPGSAAVFEVGAIHYEMNPTCEPAMFVAGFNDEDPGVSQIGQRFFGLPPDIVAASLGGIGVVEVAGLEELIPNNIALGVDSCLQACGIQRGEIDQPTDQREPRNSYNALPSGYPAPTTSIPQYTSTAYLVAPAVATSLRSSTSSSVRPSSSLAVSSSVRPSSSSLAVSSSVRPSSSSPVVSSSVRPSSSSLAVSSSVRPASSSLIISSSARPSSSSLAVSSSARPSSASSASLSSVRPSVSSTTFITVSARSSALP